MDSDPPGYHLLHPTRLVDPMVEEPLVEWSVERGDWTQTGRWVARRGLLDGVTVFKRPPGPSVPNPALSGPNGEHARRDA